MKLFPSKSLLLIIDVQEKIFSAICEKEEIKKYICTMIEACSTLGIPFMCTEQYPEGLGPTLKEVKEMMKSEIRHQKTSFSCLGDERVISALEAYQRRQILICGIETHICVYQTVRDLLFESYEVHVLTDAIMARHKSNHRIGIKKMADIGAKLTSVEMALFELVADAQHKSFKTIASLIK